MKDFPKGNQKKRLESKQKKWLLTSEIQDWKNIKPQKQL